MLAKSRQSVAKHGTEILILCLVWALAIVLFAVFFTYSSDDPGWNNSNVLPSNASPINIGGTVGAHIADLGIFTFGFFSAFIPLCIAQFGWNYTRRWTKTSNSPILVSILFFVGIILAMIGGCGLEHLYFPATTPNYFSGGILGFEATRSATGLIGPDRRLVSLLFIGLFVLGTAAIGIIPWNHILNATGHGFLATCRFLFLAPFRKKSSLPADAATEVSKEKAAKPRKQHPQKTVSETPGDDDRGLKAKPRARPGTAAARTSTRVEPKIVPIDGNRRGNTSSVQTPTLTSQNTESQRPAASTPTPVQPEDTETSKPVFPTTALLDPSNKYSNAYSEQEIIEMGRRIESMLNDFNVVVEVRKAYPGPVITQFEIEPAAGTKASQIVGLSADLARVLTVQSVRVVENIPGSSHVGIEVPNKTRELVRLIDSLESDEYKNSDHPLTIILGKDIRGATVLSNLAMMPHLLIAGTTGAGKSVCLNAILLSFLFKSTPENLRLLMIDPKMLEFSIYEDIPHLLAPVITDMNKTEKALRWCIAEMERRFQLMAAMEVRNLENLNETIRKSNKPIPDPLDSDPQTAPTLKPLPYIVFVIDELSDLIMVMGKKAEELIIRIAQRARAAGIHMIVATQRPSTDVIRGVLKANIPTRIGFKVASNADSRTILDQAGAENLLGAGDMLFLPPGSASMMRVHGAFVSDDEVKRVVDTVKYAQKTNYDEQVTAAINDTESMDDFSGSSAAHGEDDELYDKAVDFVIRSRRPTISSVQRHLRIGYNRAARMIETMEGAGVVGPVQAGGKREVLVPPPND
ncbi:MAG: DNA translocase FtsK 4TM domain-containing protein [Acidiferrobacterales bacterium]|nr:DNA translocase FtsK 4TM domain-containing protein [Acidiferrobacterales bacterium]